MHEIDRIDVRMLTYRQLCERFALYTNLGCDSRAEDMCIVFEMNMTARRPTRTRASSQGGVKNVLSAGAWISSAPGQSTVGGFAR